VDFIRRRILDLDCHILTSFLPVYTSALLKWTAFGTFRAGADPEAALFTEARRRGQPVEKLPRALF
jgi:hypothetical protein